jgi:hypothetical protein
VVSSFGAFVQRRLTAVVRTQALASPGPEEIAVLAHAVTARIDRELQALLDTDIDAQRTTPLSVLRGAVAEPAEVLRAAGAHPVRPGGADRWEVREDPYALAPDTLADLGDEAHEAGLAWGAAKAFVHLRRRR